MAELSKKLEPHRPRLENTGDNLYRFFNSGYQRAMQLKEQGVNAVNQGLDGFDKGLAKWLGVPEGDIEGSKKNNLEQAPESQSMVGN